MENLEWDRIFAGHREAPGYVGLRLDEARQLAVQDSIVNVRIADLDADPTTSLTFDLKDDRLTLVVRNGRVIRSAWF